MTVGERLKAMLDRKGYSTTDAAEAAGMSRQQVHQILSGTNDNPGIKVLDRIVQAVGGTLGELFADEA